MRAVVAFALSGIALGCAAVWMEIGIREILLQNADEAWEKAATPEPVKAE